VDGAPDFTACTGATTASANVTLPPAPANGATHDIQIRAVNAAGPGPAVTAQWQLDPALPMVTFTSLPSGATPTIEWTVTGGSATVTCELTGVPAAPATPPCVSPVTFATPLDPGSYTFTVTATNKTGSDPPSVNWSVP
jgi:hypothetical protein